MISLLHVVVALHIAFLVNTSHPWSSVLYIYTTSHKMTWLNGFSFSQPPVPCSFDSLLTFTIWPHAAHNRPCRCQHDQVSSYPGYQIVCFQSLEILQRGHGSDRLTRARHKQGQMRQDNCGRAQSRTSYTATATSFFIPLSSFLSAHSISLKDIPILFCIWFSSQALTTHHVLLRCLDGTQCHADPPG